jgi:hypothetical protein
VTSDLHWVTFDFGNLKGESREGVPFEEGSSGYFLTDSPAYLGATGVWDTTFGESWGRIHNFVRSRLWGNWDAGPDYGRRIWGLEYEFADSTVRFTAVDEPSSLWLFSVGLVTVLVASRLRCGWRRDSRYRR